MTREYPKPKIREATERDIEPLTRLASKTFVETYDDLSDEESAKYVFEFFTPARFKQHIESPDCHILVAAGDSLFGYIMLEHRDAPVTVAGQPQVECVRLFVTREAQGQGLGARLLDEGLQMSRKDGFEVLWLKVWDQNEDAIRFYQNRSFDHLGEVAYTEGGLDDRVIIMGRALV